MWNIYKSIILIEKFSCRFILYVENNILNIEDTLKEMHTECFKKSINNLRLENVKYYIYNKIYDPILFLNLVLSKKSCYIKNYKKKHKKLIKMFINNIEDKEYVKDRIEAFKIKI